MSAYDPKIARFRTPAAAESLPDGQTVRVGHLVASLGNGRVAVMIPGIARPLSARIALALTATRLQAAIESQQSVVVVFEGRSLKNPILIGLIESELAPSPADPAPPPAVGQAVEALVDGKRVKIVGTDEIVLECGNASITLRRNGKVVIRGAYVETHSEGTNRIKGAAVRIN